MNKEKIFITSLILIFLTGIISASAYFYDIYKSKINKNLSMPVVVNSSEKATLAEVTFITLDEPGLTAQIPQIKSSSSSAAIKTINDKIYKEMSRGCYENNLKRDDLELLLKEEGNFSQSQIKKMTQDELVKALEWKVFYTSTSSDIYLDRTIFSFKYSYNEECGQPGVSVGNIALTFDLNTGLQLSYQDIFSNSKDENLIQLVAKAYDSSQDESGECPEVSNPGGHISEDFFTNFYVQGSDFIIPSNPPKDRLFCHSDSDIHIPLNILTPYMKSTSSLNGQYKNKTP